MAWLPIVVLIVVVVAWTGPWSKLPAIVVLHLRGHRHLRLTPGGAPSAPIFNWTPFVGGSAILASWIIVALLLRVSGAQTRRDLGQDLVADVGRLPGRRLHLRPRLCLQLLGHGRIARQGLLRARRRPSSSSRRSSASSAWRCRAAIPRPTPCSASSRRWSASARLSAAAVADAELGRRRDRQADRAADRERRRVDQRVRPQRRRGDPAQFRLDLVLLGYLVLISVACYLFFPGIAVLPPH